MPNLKLLTKRLEQSSCSWDAILLQELAPPNSTDLLDAPDFMHHIWFNSENSKDTAIILHQRWTNISQIHSDPHFLSLDVRTGKKTLTLCSAHLPADQDKELYEAACDRLQDHLRRKQRVILGIDANAQLTQQHVTVPYIGEFVLPASSLTGERDLAKAAAFAGAMMTAGLTVASTMTPLLDAAQRAHGPQTRKHRTLDYLCIKDLSLSGATIGSPPRNDVAQ